jgi:hypothetical protein
MDARRKELGQHVRDTRSARGYRSQPAFADAANRSPRAIADVELGNQVGDKVMRSVEEALGWPRGSIARYLAGGPLPETKDRRRPAEPQPDPAPDPVRARIVAMSYAELGERAAEIEAVSGPEAALQYLEAALRIRRDAAQRPVTTNQT